MEHPYMMELSVTLLCLFQVYYKCVTIFSFKKRKAKL